jgi:hypothetical protein
MWTSRWDTVRGAAGWVEQPEVDGAVGPPVRYADVSIPPALMAAQSLRLDEVDRSVTGFVPGESVELVSQRRPDSSVFANPDGTKTLRVFDGVAFVPDEGMRELAAAGLALETGELLAPVDTTLVSRGDGRVAPVRAETVSFGADARDAALARVHTGAGAWMGFGLADAPRVEPVLDGSTVTYPSVADGADIRFTVTAAGSEPYRMLPVVGPARSPRPPSNSRCMPEDPEMVKEVSQTLEELWKACVLTAGLITQTIRQMSRVCPTVYLLALITLGSSRRRRFMNLFAAESSVFIGRSPAGG